MFARFAPLAPLAAVAVVAVGCSSADPASLTLTASSGSGEGDLEVTVDGDVTTERISGPWTLDVEVDGEFSARIEVVDVDGGDDAACSIQLDGSPPVEATSGGTATCSLSGRADGGSSDVSGRSETGAAPTTAPELPDEVIVATVALVEGAVTADIANTWDVSDLGAPSVFGETGLVETREFDLDQLQRLAWADHLDGSLVEVLHHRLPLSVQDSLEAIGERLRDQVDPRGTTEEIAFGLTEFGGLPAVQYVAEADDRTISWYVFRAGTHLMAVVGVDRGTADVDELLSSIVVDSDALPPLSHSTRLELMDVPGLEGNPGLRVPADVEQIDDTTLSSASLDLDVKFRAVTDAPPIDDIIADVEGRGYEVSAAEIDGLTVTVIDGDTGDGRVFRQVLIPAPDGVVVEALITASPDLAPIVDEIVGTITLS